MRYQKTKRLKKSIFRGWPLAAASLAVILVILAVFLYAKQDNKPKDNLATTANSETKGEPPAENPVDSSDPASADPAPPATDKDQSTSNTTPAPATNLKEPSDSTFVSNHNPKLSAGLALDSVCNTSPGATCKIVFTKDGVSKSLPDKITDGGGSAYWTWTLQDVGLTAGSWKVTATASLGTQAKTAADAQALEVSP